MTVYNGNSLLANAISDVERWWDHLLDTPARGPSRPKGSTVSTVVSGGTFLQFPAGGGAAQPVPTGGFSYLIGRPMGNGRLGRLANITIVCTSGSVNFQYVDANDTPSAVQTINAGGGFHDTNRVLQSVSVTGNGNFALQLNSPPGDIDVNALLFIASPNVTATVPQLPPNLTAMGNLKVAVEEPQVVTTHGPAVNVHDQGS